MTANGQTYTTALVLKADPLVRAGGTPPAFGGGSRP
jgi:hypothetical protein